MEKRQLFHVKIVCKNVKNNKFKWTDGLFVHNYRVATLPTLNVKVLGIIIHFLALRDKKTLSTRDFNVS